MPKIDDCLLSDIGFTRAVAGVIISASNSDANRSSDRHRPDFAVDSFECAETHFASPALRDSGLGSGRIDLCLRVFGWCLVGCSVGSDLKQPQRIAHFAPAGP